MRVSTLLSTVVTMGTLAIVSLSVESKAQAVVCPSAPTQTVQRGIPQQVESPVSGFPNTFFYALTTKSSNLSILNLVTSFSPGASRKIKTGTLYGFLGGNSTALTTFTTLRSSNPSQGRVTIKIYNTLGQHVCTGGFDVIVI